MAQESSDTTTTNKQVLTTTEDAGALAAAVVSASASAPAKPFKFNVHAPEFVPMSPAAASPLASPMSAPAAGGYYSPFMQVQPGLGVGSPDWSFFHDHEPVFFMPDFAHAKFGAPQPQPAPEQGATARRPRGRARMRARAPLRTSRTRLSSRLSTSSATSIWWQTSSCSRL